MVNIDYDHGEEDDGNEVNGDGSDEENEAIIDAINADILEAEDEIYD